MRDAESKTFMALVLFASSLYIPTRMLGNHSRPQRTASFVGEIMDSKCATTGSHDPIMKQLGATDARDCTLECAKDGSFVLYDSDTKTVYQLNDQEKPMRFAGQKVRISGPYDQQSQTIEIDSIELVP
jgi:hypothetical protein